MGIFSIVFCWSIQFTAAAKSLASSGKIATQRVSGRLSHRAESRRLQGCNRFEIKPVYTPHLAFVGILSTTGSVWGNFLVLIFVAVCGNLSVFGRPVFRGNRQHRRLALPGLAGALEVAISCGLQADLPRQAAPGLDVLF